METVDYVHHLAFPKLSDSEVEILAALATVCTFQDGERIFQAGQRGVPFYVLETSAIAIVDESTEVSSRSWSMVHASSWGCLAPHRPADRGRGLCQGETRAYCVGQADLRQVIQEIPDLSDKLVDAFQGAPGHAGAVWVCRCPRLWPPGRPEPDGDSRVL